MKRRERALLLANDRYVQWRMQRCAAAAGYDVFVLGDENARPLKRSRHCARFIVSPQPLSDGDMDEDSLAMLAETVNALTDEHGISVVLPGDARTTRILIRMAPRLKARHFPVPELDVFDTLNDKWRFSELCRGLGVSVPRAAFFPDRDALLQAYRRGELWFPAIVKPVNLYGKIGVKLVTAENAAAVLGSLDYRKIIYQDFIDGADTSMSLFCRQGQVRQRVQFRRSKGTYNYFRDEGFFESGRRVAEATRFDGVVNFDARIERGTGKAWLIECNPRIWNTIDIAMLVGANFVETGLRPDDGAAGVDVSGAKLRLLYAIGLAALKPWTLGRTDLKAIQYVLADPVPAAVLGLIELTGHFRRRNLADA
jgi:biotin carboxylase